MWNFSKCILSVAACASLMAPVVAESHPYHGHWHGEIRYFRGHDFDMWRGGYWHHGRYGGRFGWWWVAGGTWYFYPAPVYPYPDPYYPPAVEAPPPAAPPATAAPQPAAPQYWYYCPDPSGYYPYVPSCKAPWQKVPATPPQ